MQTITFREAKKNVEALIDLAQEDDVTIRRRGQPVAVVISGKRHKFFEAIDEAYWAWRAKEGEKSGYLGPEESMKFIQSILERDD